jgi:hypothetical protein
MTVPMIVFTRAKITATISSVRISCRVSPGAKGMTKTWSAGIRVTTQIANALTTTRMRKPMPAVSHGATGGGKG